MQTSLQTKWQMQIHQTTLHLNHRDSIMHPGNCFSVWTLVCLLEGKGYSVDVCLYPKNGIRALTINKQCFATRLGHVLLIICPREPSETLEDKSSCQSSITDILQVELDFSMG
jgi:hypothetical protein